MATRNQETNQTCQLLKHLHLLAPGLVYQPALALHRGYGVSGLRVRWVGCMRGWSPIGDSSRRPISCSGLQSKVAGGGQEEERFFGD